MPPAYWTHEIRCWLAGWLAGWLGFWLADDMNFPDWYGIFFIQNIMSASLKKLFAVAA
jgi:hypothetical protein